jgi:hypothetical protein
MKKPLAEKLPANKCKIPFVDDESHIFNQLVEKDITFIDAGWKKFEFTLASDIYLNTTQCNGLTRFDEGKVELEISLPDELAREIILHEYIHVILETMALDEGNFSGGAIKVTNEQLTWGLTRMLTIFKRLNPKLHSLLFGE